MTEAPFLRQLLLRFTAAGYRLFRNNVAVAWVGEHVHVKRDCMMNVKAGDVLIRHARVLHAGLCVGSSDLIGWRTVTVTPDMVGSRLAVFVAVEAKTGKVRVTEDQERFLTAVRDSGGEGRVERL